MYTKDNQYFLSRDDVYEMLSKENEYAKGWDGKTSIVIGFPDHTVSRTTEIPFSMMDWIAFAQKYIDEATLGYANYCPDTGAIRIRMIKAASLLVTALQVHGEREDLNRLAGVSSSKFPILHGGLAKFKELSETRVFKDETGTEFFLGPDNVLRRVDCQ